MNQEARLSQLNLTPKEIQELSSRTRTRLFQYLLRWGSCTELIQCLNVLEMERYVTLQDMFARALLGLDRAGEAVQVMRDRLKQRRSQAASVLLGRCLLANQEYSSALELTQHLTKKHPKSGPAWGLLAEIFRAQDEWDEAEKAYLQYQQVAPLSREPVLGLMKVHQHRDDTITAMAYAVRAYHVDCLCVRSRIVST